MNPETPDSDEQSELDLGVISTGSPAIDRALSPLEAVVDRPVADHPEVYEQVLAELTEAMTGEGVPVASSHLGAAGGSSVGDRDNEGALEPS